MTNLAFEFIFSQDYMLPSDFVQKAQAQYLIEKIDSMRSRVTLKPSMVKDKRGVRQAFEKMGEVLIPGLELEISQVDAIVTTKMLVSGVQMKLSKLEFEEKEGMTPQGHGEPVEVVHETAIRLSFWHK